MYEVRRYTAERAGEWNQFVATSKNGTFLFDRRFMDYHADRFADASLMVYREQKLYALLPANRSGDVLTSHGGLTYGGLVMSAHCSARGVQETFEAINDSLRADGIRRVVYKAVPWIYHRQPAEEDLYALTSVCHARLVIRDISSAIISDRRLRFAESRRSGLRKALRERLTVGETTDFAAFWRILDDNLSQKYGVRPVHSADELLLLHSRFPECIRLFSERTGKKVGFKAAGGISSAMDAVSYYSIVSTLLGKEWLTKERFRFGVSRLANQLLSACEQKTVTYF